MRHIVLEHTKKFKETDKGVNKVWNGLTQFNSIKKMKESAFVAGQELIAALAEGKNNLT